MILLRDSGYEKIFERINTMAVSAVSLADTPAEKEKLPHAPATASGVPLQS
ncbi:MAG: hypothetical protein IKH57_01205 [Clostridia bacterium]|nr:hypothetical protein [Clostridia bacterium]